METRSTAHRGFRKLLVISVLLGMVAGGLPAAPSAAQTRSPSPSLVGIERHTAAPQSGCTTTPPAAGEHCLPLSAVVTGTVATSGGRCAALVVLQTKLVASVVQYNATWMPAGQTAVYSYIGSGLAPGVTSSEGSWTTGQITYGDLTYTVPKGDGAWFLGQGSGPAPCTSAGPGNVQAWGWTAQPVVRGHVKFNGSGAAAPGIKVTAVCASGGATSTDSYGAYGFILDPGSCTIKPNLPKGEKADPTQRVVAVSTQDITNVDFSIPGGALKVAVKKIEPLRSGLAVHGIHYSQFPVDFTTSTVGHASDDRFVCESGCTDVTVSVIDPATGKAPAPHASVDVSLGSFNEGTVSFVGQVVYRKLGSSLICTTSTNGQDKDCGASLHGLETNAAGQLHLRYWAPGVIATSSTTLTVSAHCDAKPCQASPTTVELALTEQPYVIFQRTSPLPVDDVNELSEWANGGPAFAKFIKTSVTGFNVLKHALSVLAAGEKTEALVEHGVETIEKLEPIALVLEAGGIVNEALEAKAMMALFLDDSGLSPFGIGYPPSEDSASGVPAQVFQNELVNQVAVPNFLKMGNGGFWWASAGYINEILGAYGEGQATGWTISTTVYEVSYCDNPDAGECGPGYRNDVGTSLAIRKSIEPELTIQLSLSHNGAAPAEALDFDIPYDALAWTTTQPGLTGVIRDH